MDFKKIIHILWNSLQNGIRFLIKFIGMGISSQIRKLNLFYFVNIRMFLTSEWYKTNVGDVTYEAVEWAFFGWAVISFILKLLLFLLLFLFIGLYLYFFIYILKLWWDSLFIVGNIIVSLKCSKILISKIRLFRDYRNKRLKQLDEIVLFYLDKWEKKNGTKK